MDHVSRVAQMQDLRCSPDICHQEIPVLKRYKDHEIQDDPRYIDALPDPSVTRNNADPDEIIQDRDQKQEQQKVYVECQVKYAAGNKQHGPADLVRG
jgi:hypothetical protein